MTFDCVLFDVGGVFLAPHRDSIREALQAYDLAPDLETTIDAHYAGVHAIDDPAATGEEFARYLDAYCRYIGAPDVPAASVALREAWGAPTGDAWRQVIPGSLEGLSALSELDLTMGVVSNSPGRLAAQLHDLGICRLDDPAKPFAVVVDSGVVGVEKPSREIFEIALDALGMTRDRCLYVGDCVRYDVEGALSAGLHPVHLDPRGTCWHQEAHAHVASLVEVRELILAGG